MMQIITFDPLFRCHPSIKPAKQAEPHAAVAEDGPPMSSDACSFETAALSHLRDALGTTVAEEKRGQRKTGSETSTG